MASETLPEQKLQVLILIGLPGSGKSTHAELYAQANHDNVRIVSQDDLKTEAKCIKQARMYLQQGKSIVVDRTNMKARHRQVFIELAKTHNASCSALVFGDPHDKAHFDTCFERIANRTNHATLNASSSPKKIRLVLSILRKSYEPISVNEHLVWQHIRS